MALLTRKFYYIFIASLGGSPLRGIHPPRDPQVLRLDLEHDDRAGRSQSGLLRQVPDVARPRPPGQKPQRRTAEEGVLGRHAATRARTADPRRTHSRGGPSAADEHLEPPGGNHQAREDDCYHHHTLHR